MPTKYLALLFCLSLASCGFQLRGTVPVGSLEQIYIADRVDIRQISQQPVSTQLASDLQTQVSEVFTSPQAGVPGLMITSEQVVERPLSLSANLLNREIEIAKRVDYQILGADGEILRSDWLISRAQMTESQSSPSVSAQEREIVLGDINKELSRQLIYLLDGTLGKESGGEDQ